VRVGVANLQIRALLEGVRLDDISAVTISGAVGQMVKAHVVVPAVDEITRLLPRTFIQLSYSYDGNLFNHLFSGELTAMTLQERHSSTSAVLVFEDTTTYWDAAKQYFARDDELMPSEISRVTAFMGTDKSEYMPIIESAGWSIVSAFRKEPASMPGTRGLLGGVIHVLERIGGVYKGPRKFGGLNAFFNQAELRLKLTQRVWASQKDDTSVRMFKHHSFRKWVRRVVQSQSGTASFRSIIGGALGLIYHVHIPIIAPYLSRGGRVVHIPGVPPSTNRSTKLPDEVRQFVQRRFNAVKAIYAVIDKIPYDLVEKDMTEDLGRKVTRGREAYLAYKRGLNSDVNINKVNAMINLLTETGDTGTANEIFGSSAELKVGNLSSGATSYEIQARESGGRAFKIWKAVFDEEIESPDKRKYLYTLSVQAYKEMEQSLTKAANVYAFLLGKKRGGGGRAPRDVKTVDRLVETIFMPDVFFTAPPTCNVIFPDQRSAQTAPRSFMSETTRLRITTKESWGAIDDFIAADPLGMSKKIAVAPNMEDVHGVKALSDVKRGARVILPHEVYTGIIPAFQKMPYLNVFVSNTDDEAGYLQRTAEYLYAKMRMSARQISVVCSTFMPQLVCGMPALIVGTEGTTRHKIGNIQSISHRIDVAGQQASTAVNISEARFHDEEYDGVEVKKEKVSKSPSRKSGLPGDIQSTSSDLIRKLSETIKFLSKGAPNLMQNMATVEQRTSSLKATLALALKSAKEFGRRLAALTGDENKRERETASPMEEQYREGVSRISDGYAELDRAVRTIEARTLREARSSPEHLETLERCVSKVIGFLQKGVRILENITGGKGSSVRRISSCGR